MVDKIWYDWQNANEANFWSFAGGATSVLAGFQPDPQYPNGAPPYIEVRGLLTSTCSINEPPRSSLRRSRRMVLWTSMSSTS